ncbi:MAG: AzlD domain-containing protein [Clostridiales bacterium]|nr:AzlD domain-containing protein [Clostridiales bacterium]
MKDNFAIYLIVMAGITYLIRMLPLVLVKKKIKNRFLISFLHYIPYSVLSVMTVPAIFYAASSMTAALAGFAVAVVAAYFEQSLLRVAALSCAAVFAVELIITII